MASETTSTTVATRSLGYVLGSRALPPNKADIVVAGLCNDDDIQNEPTKVKQYAVESDLSAASAGTEGTAIATNTSLGYGSALQGTVVEGALIRATITDESVRVRYPGQFGNAWELLSRGSYEQIFAAIQGDIDRLAGACFEKMEADIVALMVGFSNSVGTSGVAFSVSDAFTALYTYDTLEAVTRDCAWVLNSRQVDHLRRDLAVAGGGLGGAVWTNVMDVGMLKAASLPHNGYVMSFLGRPVYQISHSLRVLSDTNTNVNGALMAIGRGTPEDGQLGGIAVVRNGMLKVRLEPSAAERGTIAVVSLEYVPIEVRDGHGVRIKTAA